MVKFHPEGGDPESEGVIQMVVVVESPEELRTQFTIARAAFGCAPWHLGKQTYDVERLELATRDLDAVSYRLERNSTPRSPGQSEIVHGIVFLQGRVIVNLDYYRRGKSPDPRRTQRVVSRAIEKVGAIAGTNRAEEPADSARESIHADLARYFPTDILPAYLILSECRDPGAAQESTSIFHDSTFSAANGYLRSEQRVYRANADFYGLEITSARFASTDDARTALQHDADEYTNRDYYGVRRVRLPANGNATFAASGRVDLGNRGSRVACVWRQHDTVVTRFQGFALEVDPLPVVQTLAANALDHAR